LWPPLATSIWPLLIAAGAGELALPVWLLVKGGDSFAPGERQDSSNG
jgi:hypothetical protein